MKSVPPEDKIVLYLRMGSWKSFTCFSPSRSVCCRYGHNALSIIVGILRSKLASKVQENFASAVLVAHCKMSLCFTSNLPCPRLATPLPKPQKRVASLGLKATGSSAGASRGFFEPYSPNEGNTSTTNIAYDRASASEPSRPSANSKKNQKSQDTAKQFLESELKGLFDTGVCYSLQFDFTFEFLAVMHAVCVFYSSSSTQVLFSCRSLQRKSTIATSASRTLWWIIRELTPSAPP